MAQSQTDATLAAAETNRRLRVLSAYAAGPTATALTFSRKPSGSSVAVSPAFTPPAGAGPTVDLAYNPHGWFQTGPGDALVCTTGAGGTTAIQLVIASVYGAAGALLGEDAMMTELLLENRNPIMLESA